jgi:hypothetical protein
MNNQNAEILWKKCAAELLEIDSILKSIGHFDSKTPFLTKYALVKSHGTIELVIKTIIADFLEKNQSTQIRNFIENKFRKVALSIRYDNLCKMLSDLDESWTSAIKSKMNKLKTKAEVIDVLKSLSAARNEFAHGGAVTVTFQDIYSYFKKSRRLVNIFDKIIK